jgi:hypothetical protein
VAATPTANVPVLSFRVVLEGYGELTIENLTIKPFPNSGAAIVGPPPLEHPVTASPSGARAVPASGQTRADALMNEPWGGYVRGLVRRVNSFSNATPTITLETPSLDETDLAWYFTGTIPGTAGNTATFAVTAVNQSKYGRKLAVGDYIMWGNMNTGTNPVTLLPQYACEIDKITALVLDMGGNPTSITVTRNGTPPGFGFFGSLQAPQNGTFWRLIDKFWQVPIYMPPQPIKLPWANMCVPAVLGTFPGAKPVLVPLLPVPGVQTSTPAAPGLRTLNGAEYVLGNPAAATVGMTSTLRVQVAGPESIRSVQAALQIAPTGVGSGVRIVVVYIRPDWVSGAGLVDVLNIAAGSIFNYNVSTNAPQKRRQMPYHDGWPGPDYPPNLLPAAVSPFNIDGSLNHLITFTSSSFVEFAEGGWLDFVVTAIGSGVAGTGPVVMVQT